MNFRDTRNLIEQIATERILILDGAMGSMIANAKPDLHASGFNGCNDHLCLTMPELISGIHKAYLEAGADIIETCSFNSTAISLADYGLADSAYKISVAAAQLARKAADAYSASSKPRFVAGSMGPTSKSAGISPDFNDPGKRAVTWDELDAAYYDNARGLLDGGADLIIIETVFDTINAKAAIFAVRRLAEERGTDIPVIVSATVLDKGGRILSGQTVEAFCVSVAHANPVAIGLNCSFGAEKMMPYIASVSHTVPCLVCAYPNAGLPNSAGGYDESPETMANHFERFFQESLVNIAGGCCGSTPAHIAAIAERAKKYPPRNRTRPLPVPPKKSADFSPPDFSPPDFSPKLAGLEAKEINLQKDFIETLNLADTEGFLDCINRGEYDEATEIAREAAEDGTELLNICMDDVKIDEKTAIKNFLYYALQFPDLARLPIMISGKRWETIEEGLKCLPGKGLVNFTGPNKGDAESYGCQSLPVLSKRLDNETGG